MKIRLTFFFFLLIYENTFVNAMHELYRCEHSFSDLEIVYNRPKCGCHKQDSLSITTILWSDIFEDTFYEEYNNNKKKNHYNG